jgi:hypothetical protein
MTVVRVAFNKIPVDVNAHIQYSDRKPRGVVSLRVGKGQGTSNAATLTPAEARRIGTLLLAAAEEALALPLP